jgi:hypothetical protein
VFVGLPSTLTHERSDDNGRRRTLLIGTGSITTPAAPSPRSSRICVKQQTLSATIEWSVARLTERERRVFERLSVFASGWTLEAAEEVCAGDGVASKPDQHRRKAVSHRNAHLSPMLPIFPNRVIDVIPVHHW